MEYEALRNCSYKVHGILAPTSAPTNASHAASWAGHRQVMGPWHHVPWCQLAADYSCALRLTAAAVLRLPPDRRNAVKRYTHSSLRDVETLSVWDANRPCLSPGVDNSTSTERTDHRQETNGGEKSGNITRGPGLSNTTTRKHLHTDMFFSRPATEWRDTGNSPNQGGLVQSSSVNLSAVWPTVSFSGQPTTSSSVKWA